MKGSGIIRGFHVVIIITFYFACGGMSDAETWLDLFDVKFMRNAAQNGILVNEVIYVYFEKKLWIHFI